MSEVEDGVVVIFTSDDVQQLRPSLSKDEAQEALDRVARYFSDRLIELGWEALDSLLHMEGYPAEDDEEEEDEYTEE